MKTIICVAALVVLAVINSQVIASGWSQSKDPVSAFVYAAVNSTDNKSTLYVRFSRSESCKANISIIEKATDPIDKDWDMVGDVPIKLRVDRKTTWTDEKPYVQFISKGDLNMYIVDAEKQVLKELMEGNILRVKVGDGYLKYNLKGSKIAIATAINTCLASADEQYFDKTSKPKVKMYNPDEDFF